MVEKHLNWFWPSTRLVHQLPTGALSGYPENSTYRASTYHTSLDSHTFFFIFFFSLPWFVCSVMLSGSSKCLSRLPLNPCILPLEKTFGMQIPRSLQALFVVFPPLSFIKDQNRIQYLEWDHTLKELIQWEDDALHFASSLHGAS